MLSIGRHIAVPFGLPLGIAFGIAASVLVAAVQAPAPARAQDAAPATSEASGTPALTVDRAALKHDETLAHENYRAAKRLCLVALHASRDELKLDKTEIVHALHDCSRGDFEAVMHRIDPDTPDTSDSVVHYGPDGPELVDPWEVEIRDARAKIEASETEGPETEGNPDPNALSAPN